MDELSNLLKEAKPLYKKRKQRRTIAKSMVVLIIPLVFVSSLADLYIKGNNVYLAMENNNNFQGQLLQDDYGLRP